MVAESARTRGYAFIGSPPSVRRARPSVRGRRHRGRAPGARARTRRWHRPGAGRVGGDGPLRGLHEVEPAQELVHPLATRLPPEVPQIRHQLQVLLAAEQAVDRRELAGDADDGADGVRLASDVMTADLDHAVVR